MKILITGGNGYIGSSLYKTLKDKYDVILITRKDFNLTNPLETLKYFSDKYFDVIIHCAVSGGNRLTPDNWEVMDNNLKMYYNLLNCKSHFTKLIHFNSGAETNFPESPYGLSKKVIANSISEIDNFFNIKIFAVFDEHELNTRFIKSNIKRYINKEEIIIHQNKLMDFFYMPDLVTLVNYYIKENHLPKVTECSYDKKYSLLDIANLINNLSEHKVSIKQLDLTEGNSYIGKTSLQLNYVGLEKGIQEVYNSIK